MPATGTGAVLGSDAVTVGDGSARCSPFHRLAACTIVTRARRKRVACHCRPHPARPGFRLQMLLVYLNGLPNPSTTVDAPHVSPDHSEISTQLEPGHAPMRFSGGTPVRLTMHCSRATGTCQSFLRSCLSAWECACVWMAFGAARFRETIRPIPRSKRHTMKNPHVVAATVWFVGRSRLNDQ